MRLLLDTQALLWVLQDSIKLGPVAREQVMQAEAVYVSSASIWEATIKAGLGKLSLPASFVAAVKQSGFTALEISWEHAEWIEKIQLPHRDPFDRLLLAQAKGEDLKLLTADEIMLVGYKRTCFDARQ